MKHLNLLNLVIEKGGDTLNKNLESVYFDSGFQVAKSSTENLMIPIDSAILQESFDETIDKLVDMCDESSFIGAWRDNGIIYLELSEHIEDFKIALEVAKIREQKAIYDWKNKTSIFIEENM